MSYSSNVFSRIINTCHLVGDPYSLENQLNLCDFKMIIIKTMMMIIMIIIILLIIMWST